MEFWGVEVKPGQSLKVQPEYCKLIHISQASLGETKDGKGPQNVPLRLKVNGKEFVIGSLAAEERSQLMFDLVFEKEFELSHGWKNGSVYFLGYIADDQVSDGDDFSDLPDDESEDELVAAPENVNAKPKPETVAAATKANGAVKKEDPASDEDEDDSDDDEDDDIDSDDLMESSEEELPQKVQPPKKRPAESPKNAAPGKKAKPEQRGSAFASKATGGKPQQGSNKKPQQVGNKKPQHGGNKFNGQKGKAGGQRRF